MIDPRDTQDDVDQALERDIERHHAAEQAADDRCSEPADDRLLRRTVIR